MTKTRPILFTNNQQKTTTTTTTTKNKDMGHGGEENSKRTRKPSSSSSSSSLFFFFLSFSLLFSLFPHGCVGVKWYVRNGFEDGNGSIERPYGNFQEAFSVATSEDEILAFPGTYPPEKNAGFALSSSLSSISLSSVSSSDNVVVNLTGQSEPFLTLSSSSHASITDFSFFGSKENVLQSQGDLLVEHCNFYENYDKDCIHSTNGILTIRNSTFSGPTDDNQPLGAVAIIQTIGLVEDCIFRDFYSEDEGGAIYMKSSSAITTIKNCHFQNNSSPKGAAIYMEGSSVSVTGSRFSVNLAEEGGAIYSESLLTLSESSFTENSAKNGGALLHKDNRARIQSCDMINNKAEGDSSKGGAIYFPSGKEDEFEVFQCYFYQNSASSGGAIFSESSSIPLVSYSNFTENTAENDGGAIASEDAAGLNFVRFTNNTAGRAGGGFYTKNSVYVPSINTGTSINYFTNNEAKIGGGAYLQNCTGFDWRHFNFYGNKAGSGAGIAIMAGSEGHLSSGDSKNNLATEGKGADYYFHETGTITLSSPNILTNVTTPYVPQSIIHIEGIKKEENIIHFISAFGIDDILDLDWPEFIYVKESNVVVENAIPPIKVRNSSLSYCETNLDTALFEDIIMENSDLYLSLGIRANSFLTTRHDSIQRGPSKENCRQGPFYFNETIPSSPLLVDVGTFFGGEKTISQNINWECGDLNLNYHGADFFVFGGNITVQTSARIYEGQEIGDPKNKSFVFVAADDSTLYFWNDVVIYGDLSLLEETSLFFVFTKNNAVEIQGDFDIVSGKEINTAWDGNVTFEQDDQMELMNWENSVDWDSKKVFKTQNLYDPPNGLYGSLMYSTKELFQVFTTTPPPPPSPPPSSSDSGASAGAIFLLVVLITLLLILIFGIGFLFFKKRGSGGGEGGEEEGAQRKTGGWWGLQEEE